VSVAIILNAVSMLKVFQSGSHAVKVVIQTIWETVEDGDVDTSDH